MKHVDQHILELYVLGDKEILRRRASIERHLLECAGCGSLVKEMQSYYVDLDRHYKDRAKEAHVSEEVLARSNEDLPSLFTAMSMPVPRRGDSVGNVRRYIRQHPVLSAGSGVFLLGALVLLGSLTLNSSSKDKTLVSFKYNGGENTLEALNGSNEVLWKKPSKDVMNTISVERQYRTHWTRIADLDQNGKHELITIIPQWDKKESDWTEALRVFSADDNLLWESKFTRVTHYRDRDYAANFRAMDILVENDNSGKGREVLVAVLNNRSPNFLARFDHRGELLGEYWHFGHLARISNFGVESAGDSLILLAGINDMDDSTNRSFPVIVALNPKELKGQTESSVTRGFGFPESKAEVFYVRLPRSDVANALEMSEGVTVRLETDGMTARFCVSTSDNVGLEYAFSKGMEVVEVKPFSGFEALHAKLASEGKIRSTYGPEYFEQLKRGVRYWNGKEWRKVVARVQGGHFGPVD